MGAHATHQMHDHSMATFRDTKASRDSDAAGIVLMMHKASRPLTDREILAWFVANERWTNDLNKVRPRITELVKSGRLFQAMKRTDPVTGRKVRAVWLKSRESELGDIDVR